LGLDTQASSASEASAFDFAVEAAVDSEPSEAKEQTKKLPRWPEPQALSPQARRRSPLTPLHLQSMIPLPRLSHTVQSDQDPSPLSSLLAQELERALQP
jgi:hypothetical protein